jgi:glycosyltransferase involved in cell wall biosynthesis
MEGEHFGIAPVEGLASGCVTLVHNSGGMREFIPSEYRWDTYEDLKSKIVQFMEYQNTWERKRKELWINISDLAPEMFQERIWSEIQLIL